MPNLQGARVAPYCTASCAGLAGELPRGSLARLLARLSPLEQSLPNRVEDTGRICNPTYTSTQPLHWRKLQPIIAHNIQDRGSDITESDEDSHLDKPSCTNPSSQLCARSTSYEWDGVQAVFGNMTISFSASSVHLARNSFIKWNASTSVHRKLDYCRYLCSNTCL